MIQYLSNGNFDVIKPHIVCPQKPKYIGLALSKSDRSILECIVNKHCVIQTDDMTKYLSHMTVFYYEKEAKEIPCITILPGEKINRLITKFVIRNSDGACAFFIEKQPGDIKDNLHITALIPNGLSPSISNNFVGLTDHTVTVYDINIPLKMTVYYSS